MIFYCQCQLVQGVRHQTSWIPQKFAVKGRVLRLKNADGEWENGWKVENVSKETRSEDTLPDYRAEVKAHRRATGDTRGY